MGTRQLIESCHKAWTTGDFGTARNCLADTLDFKGSIGTFSRADRFLEALKGFKGMVRGVRLLKSYFGSDGGALLCDCDTVTPAGVVRTSEFISVSSGKISEVQLVLDATELRKLMGGLA